MKKLLTLVVAAFLCCTTFGQIGAIQTKQKAVETYQYEGATIVEKVQEGSFSLAVHCSKDHEKVNVSLPLGNLDEAKMSIQNLMDVAEKEGEEFDLMGYKCKVDKKGCITFLRAGKLAKTIGTYTLDMSQMQKMLKDLNKHK